MKLGSLEEKSWSLGGNHVLDLADSTEFGAVVMKAEGLPLQLVLECLALQLDKVGLSLLLCPILDFRF